MQAAFYVFTAVALGFYMQYLFCRKIKYLVLKLLPSCAVFLLMLLDVLILKGYLGQDPPPQEFNEFKVKALVFFVIIVGAAVGVVAGWIANAVKSHIDKNKNSQS